MSGVVYWWGWKRGVYQRGRAGCLLVEVEEGGGGGGGCPDVWWLRRSGVSSGGLGVVGTSQHGEGDVVELGGMSIGGVAILRFCEQWFSPLAMKLLEWIQRPMDAPIVQLR